jgi:RES domain-containing protein
MASRSSFSGRAYRMADPRHSIFDGGGAYLNGGRWNSPGRQVIYAAETYAGALLETLVHLNFDYLPLGYSWIEIVVPKKAAVERISATTIRNWNSEDFTATRAFGDHWHREKRTAVLLVPSVVTSGIEHNVLINPEHPEARLVKAGDVSEVVWDERLFDKK